MDFVMTRHIRRDSVSQIIDHLRITSHFYSKATSKSNPSRQGSSGKMLTKDQTVASLYCPEEPSKIRFYLKLNLITK